MVVPQDKKILVYAAIAVAVILLVAEQLGLF